VEKINTNLAKGRGTLKKSVLEGVCTGGEGKVTDPLRKGSRNKIGTNFSGKKKGGK